MIDGYDLNHDLAAIIRALKGDMPEAAIFYCGRALEVTSARAVSALNLDPGNQVFANLDTLDRLSCISRPAHYLGHALRRLANDARHILRPLAVQDADFAALCLGPWLTWYMEDYFRGPRTRPADETFGLATPLSEGTVASVLDLLRRSHGKDISAELLTYCDDRIAHLPALSSMVAEHLIGCGHADQAQTVLKAALAISPTDLRLNQLFALGRRRAGHPEEAIELLKKLSGKFSEDEETLGITAGALKSWWDSGHGPSNALPQALKLYLKGWQISRERNLYLGVNAAALMLWQNDTRARGLARQLSEIFAARNAQLAKSGIDVDAMRGYYDMVTEAEARLLAGDEQPARDLYMKAFAGFAAEADNIKGTRLQANRSLALLGLKPLA